MNVYEKMTGLSVTNRVSVTPIRKRLLPCVRQLRDAYWYINIAQFVVEMPCELKCEVSLAGKVLEKNHLS